MQQPKTRRDWYVNVDELLSGPIIPVPENPIDVEWFVEGYLNGFRYYIKMLKSIKNYKMVARLRKRKYICRAVSRCNKQLNK